MSKILFHVLQTATCADFVQYFVEKIRSLPHAAYKKIPIAALQKLETPMNLICVTPVKAEVLCSEFKEDIYWKIEGTCKNRFLKSALDLIVGIKTPSCLITKSYKNFAIWSMDISIIVAK